SGGCAMEGSTAANNNGSPAATMRAIMGCSMQDRRGDYASASPRDGPKVAVDRKLPVSHAFGLSFRIAGCTDGRTTDVPGRGVHGPPGARGPGHAFPARATDPA